MSAASPLFVITTCCFPDLQKILDQFGKQFTWDLKAKQMGKKALESALVRAGTWHISLQHAAF
jgi:hypothetical protein